MTVKQLIESLSNIQDQDITVMVTGYEGGYDDIVNINPVPIDIALNVNNEWYYGPHETIQHICAQDLHKYNIVKAIVL
jgi:hypothetical protein